MADQNIAYLILGGGITLLMNVIVQAIRSRGETESAKFNVNAKLEEHWTDTTLELVDALRAELSTAREELKQLRPMMVQLGHLDEALDHIHALLAALRSGVELEITAAVRRAQAFLGRMRGEQAKGEARQVIQTVLSAQRIVNDTERTGD